MVSDVRSGELAGFVESEERSKIERYLKSRAYRSRTFGV